MRILGFIGFVAGLAAHCACAQTSLPDQIDLARLVDLSAQRLAVRVSYDDSSLKGRVTLRSSHPVSDSELWQLTNRLLIEQGFTTVWSGDDQTLAVVKLASAAQAARIEPLKEYQSAKGVVPGFRRVLIPLRRASGKDVSSVVQLVLSKPGGVVADSEQAGLVIVADVTSQVDVAIKLVDQFESTDSGLGGAEVKEVPARFVDAQRLALLAKQLADKRKQVGGREIRGDVVPSASGLSVLVIAPRSFMESWDSILSAVDQREVIERRSYPIGSFGLKEVASLIEATLRSSTPTIPTPGQEDRFRIVQDDLTGTLIIAATASQHAEIAEIIQRLQTVPIEARRPVRSFKIRNRGVKELQTVLEDLLRTGALDGSSVLLEADTLALGSSRSPDLQYTPRSSPVVDPLSGTAGATLASTPGLAPQRTRQDRGLASPSLTLTSDEATNTLVAVGEPRLLAQLEQLIPTLDVRQPQVMLEAMLISLSDSQSLDFGVELERLRVSGETMIRLSSLFGLSSAGTAGSERTRTVGDGSGFTGSVLNPGDFSVVIRALETINQGRSLSRPKVLVNNNQQASFNSVLQQPFSSTNASNTVSTTSFGGTQDAGTTISVKPQIAEGDHLVLTYSISLSSFVGAAANANLPPPRQQNSVQSVATIPDGYTVVVGGLELTTSGDGKSQVPGIGSIPLIGELFKNQSKSSGRQRFYVFLRANVMRNSSLEDLKYVSDQAGEAVHIPTDWPQVEPRMIR